MTHLVVEGIHLNVYGEKVATTARKPEYTCTRSTPIGFQNIDTLNGNFSGHESGNDFEMWLMDFKEATEHYGWNDEQRTKWLSWFLSAPEKAMMQCTLKS